MPFTVERKDDANLPVEQTYGEKMHDLIFNKLINFWTTLAISGLFVFWVKHYERPIGFLGNKLPRDFHNDVRQWFSKQGMFTMLPGGNEVARVTADALTINLPGLSTILPSAWLGNKFKTPIVEALDKAHYGDDNEKDPRIAERHRLLEAETHPTFFGALGARLGGMTAGVFTGYLIGAQRGQNMISLLGKNEALLKRMPSLKVLEGFEGVDHYASNLGDRIGGFVTELFPGLSKWLNESFRKGGIGWDPVAMQGDRAEAQAIRKEFETSGGVYNRSTRDWGKWTSADVMYTIVTSSTIGPFVSLIGKLPGMSYHQKPQHHAAVAALAAPAPQQDQPQSRITHAMLSDRIAQPAPQELQA